MAYCAAENSKLYHFVQLKTAGRTREQNHRSIWTAVEQVAMEAAEAAMMPPQHTTATAPTSPVMDAPASPRPGVGSDDTKTFDRGKRKHTHTHIDRHDEGQPFC
eukprot:COSAG01_NODE_2036_length_8581_cov_18.016977_6_plen_104_part_00